MAKTHQIKIWERWFDAVRLGSKTFEIRKDDRHYEVGDKLVLEEYRHMVGQLTGRKIEKIITYIQKPDGARVDDPTVDAIAPGYCVLGIKSL